MKRDFDYRRRQEQRVVAHKLHIVKHAWGNTWLYNHLIQQPHRLAKHKIHCSCPMCSEKTNHRHLGVMCKDSRRLGNHWSIRDIRHQLVDE